MDRSYRDERLKAANHKMLAGSALADGLAREYSLNEIAIITRAGPARLLGLATKGHLGPGADADITLYAPDPDRTRMFSTPRYVLKGGALVVDDGHLRRAPQGRRHAVRPAYDPGIERPIREFMERYLTVSVENFGA
jgi:formylmethanofuran dehydrogenase subunit A